MASAAPAPAAVLDAYRRAAEATSGMRVYGVAADGLLIDARPSAFVLDGDGPRPPFG